MRLNRKIRRLSGSEDFVCERTKLVSIRCLILSQSNDLIAELICEYSETLRTARAREYWTVWFSIRYRL